MSVPSWAIGPGRPSLLSQRVVADGAVMALLLGWLVASRSGLPDSIAPDPGKVLPLALRLFVEPDLAKHTYSSLARVLLSSLLAVAIGTALMIAARFVYLSRVLIAHRLVPFLNAFPTIGWAILTVVWFGLSDLAVLVVMVLILMPFTMVNVWSGLLRLDEDLYEMTKSFTRDRWRRLGLLVLPALLPEIVSSLRISYGVGWKVGLFTEIFGVTTGLGYLMSYARTVFDTALVYAAIVAIIALVFALDWLVFARLERYLTRHRTDAVRDVARAA